MHRRHAVGDRGGGGVGHFEGWTGGGDELVRIGEDELDEPVSSCQTWGLRRKGGRGGRACFDTAGKLRS